VGGGLLHLRREILACSNSWLPQLTCVNFIPCKCARTPGTRDPATACGLMKVLIRTTKMPLDTLQSKTLQCSVFENEDEKPYPAITLITNLIQFFNTYVDFLFCLYIHFTLPSLLPIFSRCARPFPLHYRCAHHRHQVLHIVYIHLSMLRVCVFFFSFFIIIVFCMCRGWFRTHALVAEFPALSHTHALNTCTHARTLPTYARTPTGFHQSTF
jgi:hypothetical protein